MGLAAGVAAAAATASAANSIANSGGSISSTNRPFNSGYLDNGDEVGWNLLNHYYAGQGANYGFPTMSPEAQSGIRGAAAVTPLNQGFLEDAQKGAEAFGTGGYLGTNPAYGYLGGMAAGGATNPWLDATYNQAAGQVRSSLDSQFEGAGRYGSGSHEYATGDALGNLATKLYGGEYDANQNRALQAGSVLGQIGQNERQQQLASLGLQPSLVGGQVANYTGLLGAGTYQDTYNHNAYMNPLSMTQAYQNVIATGNSGGVNSEPYYTNPAAGVVGAGLLAGQLANSNGQYNTGLFANNGAGTFGGTINSWLGTNGMGGVAQPGYLSNMNTGLTTYGGAVN